MPPAARPAASSSAGHPRNGSRGSPASASTANASTTAARSTTAPATMLWRPLRIRRAPMMGSSFILLLTNKMAASPRSGSTPGIRVACPPISQRLGTSAFDPRITHTRFQRSPAVPLYRKRGRQLQWTPSKPLMQPCRSCRSRGRREGQLARDLRERRHREFELRRAVRGRDLHAVAGLSLRYHGIRKPKDVDALVEQARGHALREVGVVVFVGLLGCLFVWFLLLVCCLFFCLLAVFSF